MPAPIVAALLIFGMSAPSRAADATVPHVRVASRSLSQLLAAAADRSSTLQALVDRLDQSDVIVYVEAAVLPSDLQGRLRFTGTSSGWRYLRVQIDCRQNLTSQVAVLGHELQHAVEIAGARGTVDEPSLLHLYQGIGFALDTSESRFESNHAIEAGVQVRREWLAGAALVRRMASD